MKIAGIIGGILTIILGICIIAFSHLLAWLVGGYVILTGIVYIFQWVKK